MSVKYGVPQRSVLETILFSIFINDLPLHVKIYLLIVTCWQMTQHCTHLIVLLKLNKEYKVIIVLLELNKEYKMLTVLLELNTEYKMLIVSLELNKNTKCLLCR